MLARIVRCGYAGQMILRAEQPPDVPAIRSLIIDAFLEAPHSDGTEAQIVDGLRKDAALTVSLVAEYDGVIVGHIAFSPVLIDGRDVGWIGLGPLAVHAGARRQGIGAELVRAGMAKIAEGGARGCVVLGDPAYYGRFGFVRDGGLTFAGVPPEYFLRVVIDGSAASGLVTYHSAFSAR